MFKQLKGLYAISDEILTPQENIFDKIEETLQNRVNIIQYRDKNSSYQILRKTSKELQQLCNSYGALFVLNDHIDLAIELGCDALHIGKSDYHRFNEIRKNFLGLIGVSCYGDIIKAKEFEEKGADYVAFGSFFPSPTKPSSGIVPLETLAKAKEILSIPVCAIGGINSHNVNLVCNQKPDMICSIDAIFNGNISKNISKFRGEQRCI